MANPTLDFQQAAAILNSLAHQVTGSASLTAVDTKTFVSVAQSLLSSTAGLDPLAQGISQVLDRTIFSVRPYYAKFRSMEKSAGEFGAWDRKINYIDDDFVDDAAYPLTDGQSVDQYIVRKPKTLQLNFVGQNIVSDYITRTEEQLKVAFRGPDEFGEFFAGALQNLSDKHEQKAENVARMNLINLILGIVANAGNNASPQVVKLLTEYNTLTGQSLTATTVMDETHYTPFTRWAYSRIAQARDALTDRCSIYHLNVTGKVINRHTPYDKQVLYMYAPELRQMEARVMSETYNQDRIKYAPTEVVNYWQSIKTPTTVKGKPAYMGADGTVTNANADVTVENIFAVLTDVETMGVRRYSEGMRATPFNARGRYTNMWYHWRFRNFVDYTENAIVFLLS